MGNTEEWVPDSLGQVPVTFIFCPFLEIQIPRPVIALDLVERWLHTRPKQVSYIAGALRSCCAFSFLIGRVNGEATGEPPIETARELLGYLVINRLRGGNYHRYVRIQQCFNLPLRRTTVQENKLQTALLAKKRR